MNQLMKKKMSQFSKKNKKGFTLVELIIVIAIIAILAAIAIPKFGAARHQANVSADQANGKIIATAVATAVSNGDTNPEQSATFSKYIDGGNVPTPKSGGTAFVVTYTDASGVVVKLNDTGTTQVYPVD